MQIEICVENCTTCHRTCLDALARERARPLSPTMLRMLLDCAQICHASAGFLSRRSPFHVNTCAACADICDECAEACDSAEADGLDACAEVCRRCAECCRAMVLIPA